MESEICECKRCKQPSHLIYRDECQMRRQICQRHWEMYCDGDINLQDTTVYRPRKRGDTND